MDGQWDNKKSRSHKRSSRGKQRNDVPNNNKSKNQNYNGGNKLHPINITLNQDILAIHGMHNTSDSDGGMSELDEEYFKYRPDPIVIDKEKVVRIKGDCNEKLNGNELENELVHNKKNKHQQTVPSTLATNVSDVEKLKNAIRITKIPATCRLSNQSEFSSMDTLKYDYKTFAEITRNISQSVATTSKNNSTIPPQNLNTVTTSKVANQTHHTIIQGTERNKAIECQSKQSCDIYTKVPSEYKGKNIATIPPQNFNTVTTSKVTNQTHHTIRQGTERNKAIECQSKQSCDIYTKVPSEYKRKNIAPSRPIQQQPNDLSAPYSGNENVLTASTPPISESDCQSVAYIIPKENCWTKFTRMICCIM